MAVTRVALQAALAQLAAGKLFADSNGLLIAHSGVKVGSFTRDTSIASGTQAVTGVGFQPAAVIFFVSVESSAKFSVGFDDGTTKRAVYALDASTFGNVAKSIYMAGGADNYDGYISAFGSDGFTITWTKSNNPTGTATISYIALR